MKDKSKVLKTYGYMLDKLQFICLIGGLIGGAGFQPAAAAGFEHLLIVAKRL